MATQTFDEASLQALVANATQSNDIVLENLKQGNSRKRVGHRTATAMPISRASRPTSASISGRRSTSRSPPIRPTTASISIGSATMTATAHARSRRSTRRWRARRCSRIRLSTCRRGLIDAGNWSVSATWDVPADAVSGVYFAKLSARTARRARTSSRSSCATTATTATSPSRPPTRPGRPTMPGAAPASTAASAGRSERHDRLHAAELLLRPAGDRPRLGCQLQPALHHHTSPDRRRLGLHLRRRVSGDPLARAERLRRQLHLRRRHRRATARSSSTPRSSCRSATTSTGPASSARMSRRRGTPASTSHSGAATRSIGRPAGRPASTAPARPIGRWSPTRRPGRIPTSIRATPDRHLARSALPRIPGRSRRTR